MSSSVLAGMEGKEEKKWEQFGCVLENRWSCYTHCMWKDFRSLFLLFSPDLAADGYSWQRDLSLCVQLRKNCPFLLLTPWLAFLSLCSAHSTVPWESVAKVDLLLEAALWQFPCLVMALLKLFGLFLCLSGGDTLKESLRKSWLTELIVPLIS